MNINILLSTYNGERFLAEQIQSIQKQTIKDWTLLIRDDGSTDRTPDIIREFVKQDQRIQWINENQIENFGVIKNFYTLLKYQAADVYFFSDQDDIWLEDKLEVTLLEAQKHDLSKPLLVYTDLKVVNQQLEITHASMIKTQSAHANTTLLQELTENTVTGGTMMINQALAKEWNTCEGLLMHDWYLALVAAARGKLVYLDIPTELYRQHDANVLGARTWSKRMKHWLRPHQLIRKYWWLITSSQQQAQLLLDLPLQPKDRDMVEAYVSLLIKSLTKRLATLKTYGFRKNRAFHTLVFWSLVITLFGYRRK
ncbi:glycosyltransferase family 2 protein [Streptococcus dysgalactiae]|uniref:glycosyltransferase family 2 protein n=1 Tax=Streptococcus dysgalactiae TaxID=1334 RepID=UPI000F7113E3|nr:glycosyltransferase family 2 protein [Streptococcus dysgalactiae]MEE3742813.1 glycosyltransferase family 2 protein [Streptococcus dysgalactiae]VDZ40125.1 alpha-L-rhaalpha-1,3-L-rhamnosyltransferase [Streptococcus dysgalactiae subsp. dysgalactiae]